jgi:hydroxyacyl-ACP dehydratase HTD2-like protein with hotdog domain
VKHQAIIGKAERHADTVWPSLVRAMAATLDVPEPNGGYLPPLWHWMLFQDWASTRELGVDGHPPRGGFLPIEPTLPRRMWVGGRLQFRHPLRIGEPVTRDSTITSAEETTGSSGRLLFVTVRHIIGNSSGMALIEEQDLVYRAVPEAGSAAKSAPESAAEPLEGGVHLDIVIDAPLLFRYSAVTGNAHRIHYDQQYATGTEGYTSLVVHGPLQATLLAGFALGQRAGGTLAEFSFRGRRPALLDRCPLTVESGPVGDTVRLRTLNADRVVCTTAEARFNP